MKSNVIDYLKSKEKQHGLSAAVFRGYMDLLYGRKTKEKIKVTCRNGVAIQVVDRRQSYFERRKNLDDKQN